MLDYTAIVGQLRRSVGATTVTKLMVLNRFEAQPSNFPQQPCNQKD